MNRLSLLVLGQLLGAAACFGQSAPNDSQTLQNLLSEIRQLRQELQQTAISSQRVQILLYRLHGQEAAVARASQRLDEAREMLSGAQAERKHLAAEIKQHEEFINNRDNSQTQRKELEDRLPAEKTRLESFENMEQQQQLRESEAEQELRAEGAKLNDLRDQLDRLDKALESAGRRLSGSPQQVN